MQARQALGRDGFAVLDRVLPLPVVAAIAADADGVLSVRGGSSDYGVIALDVWRHVAACREVLPALAAVARDLLDCDEVALFQDLLIAKPAETDAAVPWHQDVAHLPLDDPWGVNMWVSLDDADARNGSLRYVPGSHLLGDRAPARFGEYAPTSSLPPIDLEGHDIVQTEVGAGGAIAHFPRTWHGSPPNLTARPRRAWSIWWTRTTARWAPERAPHPFLYELSPSAGDLLDPDRFPRFR